MTSKAPRQPKTPRQRAEEALGVAQRKVDRLTVARDRAQDELEAVEHELADAQRRLAYVKQDPALSTTTTTSTGDPA